MTEESRCNCTGRAQIHDFMYMFGPKMFNGSDGPELFVERTTFEVDTV